MLTATGDPLTIYPRSSTSVLIVVFFIETTVRYADLKQFETFGLSSSLSVLVLHGAQQSLLTASQSHR